MFDHQHYVPVMRMKPAELRALQAFDSTLRLVTTPLLECPPRVLRGCDSVPKLERRAVHFAGHLAAWAGQRIFLDLGMLPSDIVSPALHALVKQLTSTGVRPILVVTLKSSKEFAHTRAVQSVQDRFGIPICLRVSPEELRLSRCEELVQARLTDFSAVAASTSFVVDRGWIDGQSFGYEEFAELIPWQSSWETITCLAGSFPQDLCELNRGEIHRLPRSEWRQWRSLQSWTGRRPAFGDYTIQHVLLREPVAVPNYSASIRYTVENDFIILRGEGVLNENGPGFDQYNGWAKLLLDMPEYFGPSFSAGDQYVAERASNWRSSGNAQTWLQAGFSHHLTATALQVVGLLQMVRRVTASPGAPRWSAIVDVANPKAVV
jgi:hypothetical protein